MSSQHENISNDPRNTSVHTEGLFIAVEEASEGLVEAQIKLLSLRLTQKGYPVEVIRFANTGSDTSIFIDRYLDGKYGPPADLGVYTPSLFYSLEYFDKANQINTWLQEGVAVIATNYSGSLRARFGQEIVDNATRLAYYQWLDQLEFGMLGIPSPKVNLILTTASEASNNTMSQELSHDERIAHTYSELCSIYIHNFLQISCIKNGDQMSVSAINNLIWERITPMLKKSRKEKKGKVEHSASEVHTPKETANLYIKKQKNGSYRITKEGREYLKDAVTSIEKDVYAFTDKMSSTTIAAAMARLSRRGDDMRVTILDEFTEREGKDEDLLRRVITAYGDDSVQQLTGIHFVVENASNLLTKKLEWGRLAAYLEQSTRYIFFDQKDADGKFKYYTPTTLDKTTATQYHKQMDTLFERYSELVQKLTEYVRSNSSEPEENRDGAWKAATRAQAFDAARVVLPVATKSTVGIFASGQALESLIMHLQSDELAESRDTGDTLLEEARKVVPTFLERADRPDRGGAWIAYRANTRANIAALTKKAGLQPMKGDDSSAVQLTDFWPKNELDTLPHILYEHSTLGLDELKKTVDEWSYTEKVTALNTYIGERLNRRHKPGRAFETVHYNFDLLCDYGIFRDLQRHRMVDALEWQALTPHYGFETPQLVTDAGFDDLFESCFSLSMELYHTLMSAGYENEAQYATLLGHRMRWKVMMNAREAYHFMELRTSPQGHPGYRKLAKEMYDKIAEVHPLIAEGMKFVNQGEDPELTRLAAERATQFKLKNL